MASSMSDTMDYFFGPVSSQYCIWFYAISVFGFINLILVLIGFIVCSSPRRCILPCP